MSFLQQIKRAHHCHVRCSGGVGSKSLFDHRELPTWAWPSTVSSTLTKLMNASLDWKGADIWLRDGIWTMMTIRQCFKLRSARQIQRPRMRRYECIDRRCRTSQKMADVNHDIKLHMASDSYMPSANNEPDPWNRHRLFSGRKLLQSERDPGRKPRPMTRTGYRGTGRR